MGATVSALPVRGGHGLDADLASGPGDLRAAQALRCKVLGEEERGRLKGARTGLDADEFDPYCRHLLVRETDSGRVLERAARS
jgi:putative hemolysin